MLFPISPLVLIASTILPASTYDLPWVNRGKSIRSNSMQDRKIAGRIIERSDLESPIPPPIGVRKMSNDEAEMFFHEYWTFERGGGSDSNVFQDPILDKRKPRLQRSAHEVAEPFAENSTMLPPLQAPLSLHTDQPNIPLLRRLPLFQKRQYSCPANTNACTSINRPNSCCPSDQVCQLVADTGNGDVGCCSQGQTCSQEVGTCQQGYPSCPGAQGGGCCVPGSSCQDVGCKFSFSYHDEPSPYPSITSPDERYKP